MKKRKVTTKVGAVTLTGAMILGMLFSSTDSISQVSAKELNSVVYDEFIVSKLSTDDNAELLETVGLPVTSGTVVVNYYSNGDLIIKGTGEISDLSFKESFKSKTKRVYVDETSAVTCSDTNLENLFKGWSELESVNLTGIAFNKELVNCNNMFYQCENLNIAVISSIVLPFSQSDKSSMFTGCKKLEKVVFSTPSDDSSSSYSASDWYPIPDIEDGYVWAFEDGVLPYKINSSFFLLKKGYNKETSSDRGILVKTPQKYEICYQLNSYTKNENGGWIWDKNTEDFISKSLGGDEEDKYWCVTQQVSAEEWGSNVPQSYTRSGERIYVPDPASVPDGYKLIKVKVLGSDDNYIDTSIDYEAYKDKICTVTAVLVEDTVWEEIMGDTVSDLPEQPSVPEDSNIDETDSSDGSEDDSTNDSVEGDGNNVTTETVTIPSESSTDSSANESADKQVDVPITTVENTSKETIKVSKVKKAQNVKGNKIKITLAKVSGAKYQIQVSTNKKFKKNNKSYKTAKTSFTTKKLKKGKTYYVRVRTYKTISSKKLYSKWSKSKKVKVSK